MIKRTHPDSGEAAVTVVRQKEYFQKPIDLCDYSHPAIQAIIPCWQDKDGKLVSVATGEVVTVGQNDQVRSCLVGTAFRYLDGEEIILTRSWDRKVYFVPREKEQGCLYTAFGE